MLKAQCIGFLNTPPLWDGRQLGMQQFEFPNLSLHSFHPTPIAQNLRLGHQIEFIFKQLITYSDAYEILLYNLQINQEQRTIGEIDFMLSDKIRNKLLHVELTYKFYIIDPTFTEPIYQLIGPNRRDTFFLKKEKIVNHQFPLLHTEEGTKALSSKSIDHSHIEHQCCFKAQLFQPYGSSEINLGAFNRACLVGSWLRFDELNSATFAKAEFYLPSKSEWVIEPHQEVAWKAHVNILKDIEASLLKKSAPMIWVKWTDEKIEKVFVVWW